MMRRRRTPEDEEVEVESGVWRYRFAVTAPDQHSTSSLDVSGYSTVTDLARFLG
jgi:hypothetical protein